MVVARSVTDAVLRSGRAQTKQTPGRSWLGEVSAVVLQQSLRDAESAYRNFFASLKGRRKGAKSGAPRFKSRKDGRQSIRFTANARWSITGSGRLNLPKIGAVKVKWSRALPARPSSVTVIKDAAGRYFASFVIDTDPSADQARMPDTDHTIGIDLPSGGSASQRPAVDRKSRSRDSSRSVMVRGNRVKPCIAPATTPSCTAAPAACQR